MMAFHNRRAHPVSPANSKKAVPTRALVRPAVPQYEKLKLTEAPISTCANAPRPRVVDFIQAEPGMNYHILPCKGCKANADEQRQKNAEREAAKNAEKERLAAANGTCGQDAETSASNKKKQVGAPVKRCAPRTTQCPVTGAAPIHNVAGVRKNFCGARNVYAPVSCIGQDICKMLAAANDPNPCICGLTEQVPKCMVACLDWVNKGECNPAKRNKKDDSSDSEEESCDPGFCPYAHPDLTNMHPDVCANFALTGICRFQKSEEERVAPSTEVQRKKRNSRSRNEPMSCLSCHCIPQKGSFQLLPGLTKKILRPLRTEGKGPNKQVVEWDRSDLDRALAFYAAFIEGRQ